MTEQKEKVFADGLISKRNENAPDFVIINQSYKVEEFTKFLQANAKNGWVNTQTKIAKSGKYYTELDTFEPKAKTAPAKQTEVPF
jgi:hypothetical protein|tara:strand:- start:31134 stop:31388 length:255 start_codon:yes stop_codon:yes gene_type:complete